MSHVIVMSGCSGSGKSTHWAKLVHIMEKYDHIVGYTCVSADHYFMQGDGQYHFDASKLSEAHAQCFKNYIMALQKNVPTVVVDNTATTAEEIAPYMLGAQAFGYSSEIITIDPAQPYLEKYADRNSHDVPFGVIQAQANRIRARKLPPWWKHTMIDPAF